MGEQPMISERDTQHRDRVEAQAQSEVQEGQPAIPEHYPGSDDGDPRNDDGDDRRNSFGALRRTGGCRAR
jgi:hypothetical protein